MGICEDWALQIVTVGDFLVERAEAAEREARALKALVRQVANIRPAEGRESQTLGALRERAWVLLGHSLRDSTADA